jgi:hydroxyacylglutathione hydrolase
MTYTYKKEMTIAIVGGGASGVLTAFHLDHQHIDARILIIDPRPEFGLGLAYSTPSLRHLLNVPAGKISALPTQPDHFLNWLRANYDAAATPMTYAPRAVFGRYLQSILASAKGVEQLHAEVVALKTQNSGAILKFGNGEQVHADLVVLATGNFDPAPLAGVSREAEATGAYAHNAWLSAAYDNLPKDAPVTLIGTGLTAVDVVLRLRELGHRGAITAVSRHGVFPNRHAGYTATDACAIPKGTEPTCAAYLYALHASIKSGVEWRAAVDSLRNITNDLWVALSLNEQLRFKRHLQHRWDVVRHRMAPPIADRIDAEMAAGTLIIREGHLDRVDATERGAIVTIRTAEGMQAFSTVRVINCTGPAMNYRRVNSPLLQSLFASGLVSAGPLGGGFNCTPSGAMISAAGTVSRLLFNLGPGRLGTLIESIAIPEIRQQAFQLAALLAARVNCEVNSMRENKLGDSLFNEPASNSTVVAA